MFHWILSLPLNHSAQFMSVLVNLRSRLLGSIVEIGMCHYSRYNSHNIYDTGCPIWSCFLSTGPQRVPPTPTPSPPEDWLPGASSTSLGHLLFSSGCNAIQPPTAEGLQLRQNSLSPLMMIRLGWHLLIIFTDPCFIISSRPEVIID